jgi:hypothetical protein
MVPSSSQRTFDIHAKEHCIASLNLHTFLKILAEYYFLSASFFFAAAMESSRN